MMPFALPNCALLARTALLSLAALGVALLTVRPALAGLPLVDPAEVGFDPQRLALIDALAAEGLAAGQMPGCVICVGRQGQLAWLKAYGNRRVRPDVEPMTVDTVFDLASLTKPIATATSILLLVERGKLRLEDRAAVLIPEFGCRGKEAITLRQLLTHQSGLLPDNALRDYLDGPELALQRICELELQNPVGSKFVYSDVNFIVLGELIRRASGASVHEFSQREIFEPLGMTETGFLPRVELRVRAAPTELRTGKFAGRQSAPGAPAVDVSRRDAWIQGEVHDPRAFALGGVAGHAGLFSTAADLAVFAQMLLNRGEHGGRRILSAETVELMTRGEPVSSGIRGLGWDKRTGYSTNRGERFSDAAFGHGGFTGTVLWIDPQLDLFFIFPSNRLHPDGRGSVNALAGRIATAIADAVRD